MDNGLLTGIGEGLKSGVESYRNERDYAEKKRKDLLDEALKKRAQQSVELDKNMVADGQGNLGWNADKQRQLQTARDEDDPNSDISKNEYGMTQAAMNAAKPGLGDSLPSGMSASQLHKASKDGLLGKVASGAFSVQRGQITNDRINDSNDIKRGGLEERQNHNATQAGQAFESDPIIRQTKQTTNSLDRASSILNSSQPVTAKNLAIVQQDMANALAPGGAATEGKVNRELVQTFYDKLNDLQLHFGDVEDIRKKEPQLIENIKGVMAQVKQDYAHAQGEQARNIHDSFQHTSNQKVLDTVKDKLLKYAPLHFQQVYGGDSDSGSDPSSAPSGGGKGLLKPTPQGLIPPQAQGLIGNGSSDPGVEKGLIRKTKVIQGVKYEKVPGGWQEVQ